MKGRKRKANCLWTSGLKEKQKQASYNSPPYRRWLRLSHLLEKECSCLGRLMLTELNRNLADNKWPWEVSSFSTSPETPLIYLEIPEELEGTEKGMLTKWQDITDKGCVLQTAQPRQCFFSLIRPEWNSSTPKKQQAAGLADKSARRTLPQPSSLPLCTCGHETSLSP